MVDGEIAREVVPGHLAAIATDHTPKDLVEEMFLFAAFRHVAADPVAVHGEGRRFDAAVCRHVIDGGKVSAVHQIAKEGTGQRRSGFGGMRTRQIARDAGYIEVLGEGQRVEVEIDARRAAPTTGQQRAGFVNDDRVRAGDDQDDLFQEAGIGEELDAAVPPANVGHFVNQQVRRLAGRAIRRAPREQCNQRMMVVDELTGHVEHTPRRYPPIKQVAHPLLQHGGLADPPAARDGVDPGLIYREMRQYGVAVREGKTAQLSELRVHGAEKVRSFQMKVVRGKAGINTSHNMWMIPDGQI